MVILHAMKQQNELITEHALVVATYSREMSVRLSSGIQVRARIKGKKVKPVCGDLVIAECIPNEPDWLIVDIEPRRNELTRPSMRGHKEILAANLDNLCVVAASKPAPDWYIVDRYLCAAEVMGIDATVVYNKTDLDVDPEPAASELETYRKIGYSTVACSAETGHNIPMFEHLLAAHRSIIVGQSGVGKSSLINRILAGSNLRTGEISSASGEGKHTTVNSSMLILANGAEVIDSPGVRDFAPAIDTSLQAITGFREISRAGNECRFANCRHQKEPDCNVKALVDQGDISKRRYDSFRRLVVLTEQLAKKRL